LSELHSLSGCNDAERATDVVFIHGLGGDWEGTWQHRSGERTSFPRLLGEEFPQVGIWSLAFAASPSRWARLISCFRSTQRDMGHGMSLSDRAIEILELMSQRELGRRPIVFIGHSLGGLIAKQILRTASDSLDSKKRAVYLNCRAVLFLGTPHAGAKLASLTAAVWMISGATVTLKDLRAGNPNLRVLLDWYRNHTKHIETRTLFEQRGFIVVNADTAHPGTGADPIPVDEDHFSIAKPKNRESLVYGSARDLVKEILLHRVLPPQDVPLHSTVPRELPIAASQFFGRQVELQVLVERLQARKNTAIVGHAGFGKTALAAQALISVVGSESSNPNSVFRDGVVLLDLYAYRGKPESTWQELANKLAGTTFLVNSPSNVRAREACRGKDILVIVEGGEEADGQDGRLTVPEIQGVLSPENRWLLLTRLRTQAAASDSIFIQETLSEPDAKRLFETLTGGVVPSAMCERVLALLEGHPLALTWAGNLLALEDEDPERLVADWVNAILPSISDPAQTEHTLEWLFGRSVRGLGDFERKVLDAAALLSHSPFPLAAMCAAVYPLEPNSERLHREALTLLVKRGLLRRSNESEHWQFSHVLAYRFARVQNCCEPDSRIRLANWLADTLFVALSPSLECKRPVETVCSS